MVLTSLTVWGILVACAAALCFVGFWFSLRSLRWFTGVIAFVLVIAVTRFGLTHPEYTSANLVDSFFSGVDRVAIALIYPVWQGEPPAPGVAGRWIIAVALLLGYRQLEAWSLRWQAPELDLSAIGTGKQAEVAAGPPVAVDSHDDDPASLLTPAQCHAWLAAELRFRLPTMEIRSPSILPGGTRANALASIAESTGVNGAGLVGAVFRLAGVFWPSPRRIRVRSWVESVSGNRITVLLEDVKTSLPIATNTVAGASFNEAASMVAGYIARQVFAMDRTVPEWCYGVSDGRDLGAMQLARLQRVYAACPEDIRMSRDAQIKTLVKSTGTVRTAGIIRYELAQLLALQGQHLESLRLHAINRELHPRLYRGRYRFAMSLEMVANPDHLLRNDRATWDGLEEILAILNRCELADDALALRVEARQADGSWAAVTRPAPGSADIRVSRDLAHALLKCAARDLRDVRKQLDTWRVVRDAIVLRDERAVWLPHWSQRHRRAFHDGVHVAELLVAVRCMLIEAEAEAEAEAATKAEATTEARHRAEVPPWLGRARVRWHLRRAIKITDAIGGDPEIIRAVLREPGGQWWTARTPNDTKRQRRRRSRRRSRSRASWQAAYNTACVYAALATAPAVPPPASDQETPGVLERGVVDSLRRVVENPRSELERPSDWIDSDPDFRAMHPGPPYAPPVFKEFEAFLLDQKRQDYPVAFIAQECPVCHAPADWIEPAAATAS